MSDELKPCPFCGSAAQIKRNKTVIVSCSNCGASTFQKLNDKDSAITAWNRRADEAIRIERDTFRHGCNIKDARIERMEAENAELRAKLEEIRKLAECGVSHGLLADDYCSKILDVITAPVAPEPEQATIDEEHPIYKVVLSAIGTLVLYGHQDDAKEISDRFRDSLNGGKQ